MKTAEQIIRECENTPKIYPAWPQKPKIINKQLEPYKKHVAIPMYTPYYDKPKKACFCAIKRQLKKGKVMTAHLARQI